MHRPSAASALALGAILLSVSCRESPEAPPATPVPGAASPSVPASPFSVQGEDLPSPIARMSLVASSGSIVPGSRTWLGARFVIAPGWHVYGADPGDAGMPTRVRLELPEGLVAGSVSYPPTKRFVDAGDIVTHGYEREVVLHVPVDAATTLRPGEPVTIRAKGSWLACKEQCVRETAEAVLVLPVGEAQPAPPESAAIFTRFAAPASPETASSP